MPNRTSPTGSELFIVDNSDDDWKVLRYLHDWCQLSKSIDIATGYFEIGSLLALKDEWQKVDNIRILMGDEVSRRTKDAFVKGLEKIRDRLDDSIEAEKLKNDFLAGVPAIVQGIKSGKIACRVYRKDKFHAKAYLTHARQEVVGSFALVGSSNFTYPGLTENIELNVQITGRPVNVLQEWYEQHWEAAEDVSSEILRTIERHIREYLPFEVYAKSLQEFFRGHELTVGEWENAGPQNKGSRVYPILDQYQREGYQAMMKIAARHRGAFLCDGVGLGKTFIGLMVIERLILHERKRVLLLVPKAARVPVWERSIKRYLPHVGSDVFSNLVILNHTDLQRGGEFPARIQRVKEMADAIIIDEAHHFRNPGRIGELAEILNLPTRARRVGQIKGAEDIAPSRYWRLYEIADGKQIFMLTATPINNSLLDFKHMIELVSRRQPDYFKDAPLNVHSLDGQFRRMEKDLEKLIEQRKQALGDDAALETNLAEAEHVLTHDALFRSLVVQRSRAYVRQSQIQNGATAAMFPTRSDPQVAHYKLKVVYGRLLEIVEKAFDKKKSLFSLAIYYPLAFYCGTDQTFDPFVENRQKQLVRLIRTQFLKRFESSAHAFQCSCIQLLLNLFGFAKKHAQSAADIKHIEKFEARNEDVITYAKDHLRRWDLGEEEDADEDLISDEMLEGVTELSRDEYNVDAILRETFDDLDQIVDFLKELKKFKPRNDSKLQALIKLLTTDPVLSKHKVLIFSEFADTAQYLRDELREAGIEGVDEVDSSSKRDRGDILRQFAPYYNESSSAELAADNLPETRVLISTDVLSEGLNLQDATRLINYDLHWNPVRLMQRIGRVDRRMNPGIEAKLVADHPDQRPLRGKVAYWNFLPPDELDELLKLYAKVSKKMLRISRTFGIEGRKLLRPEDEYEALKEFNHGYEGTATLLEQMHLEYRQLLQNDPELEAQLSAFPRKIFSGKAHPNDGARAVFFCYVLPAPAAVDKDGGREDAAKWTEEAGTTKWYLYDLAGERTLDEPGDIIDLIRCRPDTPHRCKLEQKTLSDIRAEIEKHIKNTYLKSAQAPVGVKPVLKAWMELS